MLIAPPRGFTSIELVIGVAIVAVLLALGVPSFVIWVQDMQMRTTAESVLAGLHTARAEAVKRNSRIRFTLPDATGKAAWAVGCATATADCPAVLQQRSAAESGGNARVGVSTAAIPVPVPSGQFAAALAVGSNLPATVTFDGFGRVAGGGNISRIDVSNPTTSAARRMVITISGGGMLRMCDPAVSRATASHGC